MHMATKARPWTRRDLARLPDDGQRYEVLDGDLLVTPAPSPPHQLIALRLGAMLLAYVNRHHLRRQRALWPPCQLSHECRREGRPCPGRRTRPQRA